jgi:hypothetical protein
MAIGRIAASMSTSEKPVTDTVGVRGRVPDFFIVGQPKAGTTALYEMLGQHPRIFMSDIKEPRFLASDLSSRFTNPRGRPLPQTLDQYLSLFEGVPDDHRAGEATPFYLWSRTAAERISQIQPAARIVAILREPASLLRSLHLQFVRSHVESERDLRRALALEGERREGKHVPRRSHLPQLLHYSEHVRYVEQLRRFHEHFPREQVLVLIYDDFLADNEGTVREVLRFLDLEPDYEVATVYANPTSRTMRSQQIDDLVWSLTMGRSSLARATRSALKRLTPREARRKALQLVRHRAVFAPADAPDEQLILELHRRYAGEVAALSEYLDRDLITQWGYGATG